MMAGAGAAQEDRPPMTAMPSVLSGASLHTAHKTRYVSRQSHPAFALTCLRCPGQSHPAVALTCLRCPGQSHPAAVLTCLKCPGLSAPGSACSSQWACWRGCAPAFPASLPSRMAGSAHRARARETVGRGQGAESES